MKQLFGSDTHDGAYRITIGHDPTLHPGDAETVEVTHAAVVVTYARPRFGRPQVPTSTTPAASAFHMPLLPLYLTGLCLLLMWTEQASLLILPLLFFVLFALAWLQSLTIRVQRIIPRERLYDIIRTHPVRIAFADSAEDTAFHLHFTFEDDADAVWNALHDNEATCTPITCRFVQDETPQRHKYAVRTYAVEGILCKQKQRCTLACMREVADIQRWPRLIRVTTDFRIWLIAFALIFIGILCSLVFSLPAIIGHMMLLLLAAWYIGIICIYYIGRHYAARYTTMAPRIDRLRINMIEKISSELFIYALANGSKETGTRLRLHLPLPESLNANTVIARLQSREGDDLELPVTIELDLTPTYDVDGGYFGRGTLTIDSDTVTIHGRRWDSRPRGWRLWVPTLLVFAGLVTLTHSILVTFFPALFTGGILIAAVISIPLTIQLYLEASLLSLLPLFLPRTHTIARCDITDLERVGRQITVTYPDPSGVPTRLTFYMSTLDQARTLAESLGGRDSVESTPELP